MTDIEMKMMTCPCSMDVVLHYRCDNGWMCANCGSVIRDDMRGYE